MYEGYINFSQLDLCGVDIYKDIKIKRDLYTALFFQCFANTITSIFDYQKISIYQKMNLKKALFYSNYVAYDEDLENFIALVPEGAANYYEEYNKFRAAYGDMNKIYYIDSDKNPVGVGTSFSYLTDRTICWLYASRVAELIISIDSAVVSTRILNLFMGNENQIKDLNAFWDALDSGKPYIIIKDDFKDSFKSMQLQQPRAMIEFYEGFSNIINEFLMTSGLNSLIFPNKKERMITSEAETTNDIRNTILNDKLENRRLFFEKINKQYNKDFEIQFNTNIDFSFKNENQGMNPDQAGEGGE